MTRLEIRPETAADTRDVRRVVTAAFGRDDEADLVASLRDSPAYRRDRSLVARRGDATIGHVLLSGLTLDDRADRAGLVLAPLSVAPAHQRAGAGGRLVRAGLAAAGETGADLVFLHGAPDYYGRFGFESATDAGFVNPFDLPDEAFQVCELVPGVLRETAGTLTYPAPFRP